MIPDTRMPPQCTSDTRKDPEPTRYKLITKESVRNERVLDMAASQLGLVAWPQPQHQRQY